MCNQYTYFMLSLGCASPEAKGHFMPRKVTFSLTLGVFNLEAAKFEVLINRMHWQRTCNINDHLVE